MDHPTLIFDRTAAAGVAWSADPTGTGQVARLTSEAKATARQVFPVGSFTAVVRRWVACHRYDPYWMIAAWGDVDAPVPRETQYLLLELTDGRVALLVPLLDGPFRCSLEGSAGAVQLVAESGDPSICATTVTGLFLAIGDDPHELMPRAARAVALLVGSGPVGSGRLRSDKPVPAFIDRFGWCTWDAFYRDVDAAGIRRGLESFRAAGLPPRFVILDDGWLTVGTSSDGTQRLTALHPTPAFSGDLKPTIDMAKGEFGVETFMVWHAFMGYWGGIDPVALPGYGARVITRASSLGIAHLDPGHDQSFGPSVGVPDAKLIDSFYHDFHRQLRRMGVDGVKVDAQAALEGVAVGQGGRVALMRRFHEALEGSVHVHFRGNVINCMSCSNDMLYSMPNSTLFRSSTDFWPKRPETHALHLVSNAFVGLWFGEFGHPDWDMFQSGHQAGPYHAAGRAVSGAPIYVSDRPGEHNVALLHKLVFSDGSVARCLLPGRPSRDCLFGDPQRNALLLKIVNRTAVNAVVGVFNAHYHAEPAAQTIIRGSVTAADVPGSTGVESVAWVHGEQRVVRGAVALALPELGFEVVTFASFDDMGLAAIGLTKLFVPGAGITAARWHGNRWVAQIRDRGECLICTEFVPQSVSLDGALVPWRRASDGSVRIDLPSAGELVITH